MFCRHTFWLTVPAVSRADDITSGGLVVNLLTGYVL